MRTSHPPSRRRTAALLAGLLAAAGCSGPPPKSGAAGRAGVSLGSGNPPFVVDLGGVPPGSTHTKPVRLTNRTPAAIRVDGFQASCECTTVDGLPVDVPAGGAAEVHLVTDLAKEPKFRGGLTVTVELRSGAAVEGVVEVSCDVAEPAGPKP